VSSAAHPVEVAGSNPAAPKDQAPTRDSPPRRCIFKCSCILGALGPPRLLLRDEVFRQSSHLALVRTAGPSTHLPAQLLKPALERGRRLALELIVTIPAASPTVDVEADAPTMPSNRSKATFLVDAVLASGLMRKSPSSEGRWRRPWTVCRVGGNGEGEALADRVTTR
jgi:hypothetical protein